MNNAVDPARLERARGRRSGAAIFAALGAAALSSACCWLPILLVGLGVSGAGFGAVFEAWRMPLLVVTAAMLGSCFYLVYVRRPECEPGSACAVPVREGRRVTKGVLWLATVVVGALAMFPEYVGVLSGAAGQPESMPQALSGESTVRTYSVEGMTCEGCVTHVTEALLALPNVTSATVSYECGEAQVQTRGEADDAAVSTAIEALGYGAAPKGGE